MSAGRRKVKVFVSMRGGVTALAVDLSPLWPDGWWRRFDYCDDGAVVAGEFYHRSA